MLKRKSIVNTESSSFHLYLNGDSTHVAMWNHIFASHSFIGETTRIPYHPVLWENCRNTIETRVPLYKVTFYKNTIGNVFHHNRDESFESFYPTKWKIANDLTYIQFYWNMKTLKQLGYKNGTVPIQGNFILIRTKFKNIFFCLIRLQMILIKIRRRRKKKHLFLCATISHVLYPSNQFTKITGCGPVKERIYQYI